MNGLNTAKATKAAKIANDFQPMLWDSWTIVEPEYEQKMTIQQRFELFHRANPAIFTRLVRLALELKRHHGCVYYGIGALVEKLRWDYTVRPIKTEGSDFKLCNDYRSRYARLIMATVPELKDFFRTRELTAA